LRKNKLFVARNYIKSNMLYKFRFYDHLLISKQNPYPWPGANKKYITDTVRFCIGMNFTDSTGFYSDRLKKYLSFTSSNDDLNSLTLSELKKTSGIWAEYLSKGITKSASNTELAFPKFCADYETSKVEFYFFEINALKKQFSIGKKNYNGQVTYYKTVKIPVIPAAKVPNYLDPSKNTNNPKNVWHNSVGEYSVSLYDNDLNEMTLAVQFIPLTVGAGPRSREYTGDGVDPSKIIILEQKIKNAKSRGYFGIELIEKEDSYLNMSKAGFLPTYDNIDIKTRISMYYKGIYNLHPDYLYAPQEAAGSALNPITYRDLYLYGTDNSLFTNPDYAELGQRSKKNPFSLCAKESTKSIIKINFEYDKSFSNTKEISSMLIDYINQKYTAALGGSFRFELGEIFTLPTSWPLKLQEIPYHTVGDSNYDIFDRMFDTNFYPRSTIFGDFNGFSDIKNDDPFVFSSFPNSVIERSSTSDTFNIFKYMTNLETGQIDRETRLVKSLFPINKDTFSDSYDGTWDTIAEGSNTGKHVITARICKSPIFFKDTQYYTAGVATSIGPWLSNYFDVPCYGGKTQPSFYCSWASYPNIKGVAEIFAHELGHILGSSHDTMASRTTMAPYLWNSNINTPLTEQYGNLVFTNALVHGSCGDDIAAMPIMNWNDTYFYEETQGCSNWISKCKEEYENSVYINALLPSLPFVDLNTNGNIKIYRDQQYKVYIYDTINKKYKSVVNHRGVPQKSTFLPGTPASLGKDEVVVCATKINNKNFIILKNSIYNNFIVYSYQEYNDAWFLISDETENYTIYDFDFYDLEISLNLDLNNDGKIGLPDTGLPLPPYIDPNPIGALIYIEQNKNISLGYDTQGRLFANNIIIRGFNKLPINYFSTQDLIAVSAETVDGVDQLVFKNINDNSLVIYSMYPSPNNWLARSVDGPFGFNTAEYLDIEYDHNIDFNGDGLITIDNTIPATITITKNLEEKFPHYVDPIDGKIFNIEIELKNQMNVIIQQNAINTFVWQYNTVGLENHDEWHTLVLDSYSKKTSSSFTYIPPNKTLNHTTYLRCVIYSGKITNEYPVGNILNISNVIETQIYPEELIIRCKKGQVWLDFVYPQNLDPAMLDTFLDNEQKQKIAAIVKFPYGNSIDFTDYFGYNKLKAYPILEYENPYTGRVASTLIKAYKDSQALGQKFYFSDSLRLLDNYLKGSYGYIGLGLSDISSKVGIIFDNASQIGFNDFSAGYLKEAVCFGHIPDTITFENNKPFKALMPYQYNEDEIYGVSWQLNIASGEKFTWLQDWTDYKCNTGPINEENNLKTQCRFCDESLAYTIYRPQPYSEYPGNAYVSLYNNYISGNIQRSPESSNPGPYWDQKWYKTTPREDETEYGMKIYGETYSPTSGINCENSTSWYHATWYDSGNLIYKDKTFLISDFGDYEFARQFKFSSAVTGTDVSFGDIRIDLCGKINKDEFYWEYVWYPTGVANDFITYTKTGRIYQLYEEIRDNRYALCDDCITIGSTTTCGNNDMKCGGGKEKDEKGNPCKNNWTPELGDPWYKWSEPYRGNPKEWIYQYRTGKICPNLDWREPAKNSIATTDMKYTSVVPGFYKLEPGEKYRVIFAPDESDIKGPLSVYHPLKNNFSLFLPIPSGYDFSSSSTNFNTMSEIDTNITCTGEARPIETFIPLNQRINSFYINNAYEVISSNVGLPISELDPTCVSNILSISDSDDRLNYWKPNSSLSTLNYLLSNKNYIVKSKTIGYNLVFNSISSSTECPDGLYPPNWFCCPGGGAAATAEYCGIDGPNYIPGQTPYAVVSHNTISNIVP
jgi:hypothetical protein